MTKYIFIFLLSFLAFLSICCEKKNKVEKKHEHTFIHKVVVSVPPYIYFVKKIAGDTVDVQTMIPPNSNPHIFEPTPYQTMLATHCDIWFKTGESFEQYLLNFLKKNDSDVIISDLRENIELIPYEISTHQCCDHRDFKDIHIWTSPKLAKTQAKTIAKELTKKYPQNKELYEKNLISFLLELDLLDAEIEKKITSIKGSYFLISHPSFGYFCKDYGITQLSIEYQGKDPTLKKLSQTLEQAKEKNIKKVFVQAQYSNKGAAFIAKKMGINVEIIDPYSVDYESNLKKFVDLLVSE